MKNGIISQGLLHLTGLVSLLMIYAGAKSQQPSYGINDFKKLGWLQGKWEGSATGEATFYEQYKFLNDSTLAMLYYKDASFTGVPDTGWVLLKGNSIIHQSGKALWKLSSLSDKEVVFAPVNVKRGFVWRKENKDQWSAILEIVNKEGQVSTKTYVLKRKGND
jgi:hypothetical protein